MFTRTARVVRAPALPDSDLEPAPLDLSQVVDGGRQVRQLGVYESDSLAVGLCQHPVGVSADVEADEILVVLGGRGGPWSPPWTTPAMSLLPVRWGPTQGGP